MDIKLEFLRQVRLQQDAGKFEQKRYELFRGCVYIPRHFEVKNLSHTYTLFIRFLSASQSFADSV